VFNSIFGIISVFGLLVVLQEKLTQRPIAVPSEWYVKKINYFLLISTGIIFTTADKIMLA